MSSGSWQVTVVTTHFSGPFLNGGFQDFLHSALPCLCSPGLPGGTWPFQSLSWFRVMPRQGANPQRFSPSSLSSHVPRPERELKQRGEKLPQSPSFTALLSPAHGVLLFLAAYFCSTSSEWDGSCYVERQDKLCWYAAMVELIHKPGGSTRSNLGWKIADEFFSN